MKSNQPTDIEVNTVEVNTVEVTPVPLDESQRAKVDAAINRSMLLSGGVGIVPIPLVDFVGVTAIQLALIKQLSSLYGVEYAANATKSRISALIGGAIPAFGSMTAASWIKMVPVVGTVLGGSAMMLLSGASTYAVGHVFARHFEQGGTILDMDAGKVKSQFNEYYEAGKSKLSRKKVVAASAEASVAATETAQPA
jgi:uncharacterized protein (DUF697 family)